MSDLIAVTSTTDRDHLPAWVIDPDASIPVAYERTADGIVHRFSLGELPYQATLFLGPDWRKHPDLLVNYAAACWHKLVGIECSREQADLIARGWITAVGRTEH